MVVESEISLLQARGHLVELYTRNNIQLNDVSSLAMAKQTLWSVRTTCEITELIERFRPDVIHVHNTFPLISPSLYWAAARAGVPIVQTLHNFRLLCLNALFLRKGMVCEDCMGRTPWRGVARACYRNSLTASAVLASALTLHRGLGTYRNKVTRYIVLNEFCRTKFVEGGLSEERIVVKPNFVDLELPEVQERSGLLFVGRLSVEKGVEVLAGALGRHPNMRIRVAGDGPKRRLIEGVTGVTYLGNLPSEAVYVEMRSALALVVPSVCYENFPRTIVEAFACGLPVIASRIGALADIVTDGRNGLLFEPGNASDLAEKLRWALKHPEEMAHMGDNARDDYEAKYTPSMNYDCLVSIYEGAIEEKKKENDFGL